MIKVLSLFDGISCGMVALQRAGIPVNRYCAYEIDPKAIQISKRNHPNIEHFGDVIGADFEQFRGFDMVIGGSPCQGFSFLGKQLNFDDERSGLIKEYIRALEVIKPKYFLLENVKMKKEYRDAISEILGVEPIEINSALVSAQNRVRLYWSNIPDIKTPQQSGINLQSILESGYVDREKSLCILEQENRLNVAWDDLYRRYKTKSLNNVVFFSKDLDPAKGGRMLTQNELERLQTLPVGYTQPLKRNEAAGLIGNAWTVDVIAYIFEHLKGVYQ